MGKSPAVYTSTHLSEHKPKTGDHAKKDERIALQHQNQRTNFTHTQGFEKPIDNGSKGGMPHKGQVDQVAANAQMNYLKREHFNMGKSGS